MCICVNERMCVHMHICMNAESCNGKEYPLYLFIEVKFLTEILWSLVSLTSQLSLGSPVSASRVSGLWALPIFYVGVRAVHCSLYAWVASTLSMELPPQLPFLIFLLLFS